MPVTEQEPTTNRNGWTISTLFMHMEAEFAALRSHQEAQLNDLRRLLDERYATQTKALDAAFSAASLGVATALQSAREASAKAEENAEKRFESFRSESSTLIRSVSEKQGDEYARVADRMNELAARLDVNKGQGVGSKEGDVINALAARLDAIQGQEVGADKSKTQMLTLGALLVAGGGLLVKLLFPAN